MEFVKDGFTPTGFLRFVKRGDQRVLQMMWAHVDGRFFAEWRDVELVNIEPTLAIVELKVTETGKGDGTSECPHGVQRRSCTICKPLPGERQPDG